MENTLTISKQTNQFVGQATLDVAGTRFQIVVTDVGRSTFVVSLPNFNFSMSAGQHIHIGYKLQEKLSLASFEADAINDAFQSLTLKMYEDYEKMIKGFTE